MTAYRYVRTGRLPATRIGSQWWVDPRDLPAVAAGSPVAGRPRTETRRASRATAARRLEDRLVAGDEPGAWTIVEGRLGSGSDPDEVLLDGLGEAMRSVGHGWEAGDYTVDDEHRAVGVATRVVARLGARFTARGPKRGSVILGTPPHELHGLPTAMAANVLRWPRLRGRRSWRRCPRGSVRQCRHQGAATTGGGRRGDRGKPRPFGAGHRASRARRESRAARARRRSCHRRRGARGPSGSELERRRRAPPR